MIPDYGLGPGNLSQDGFFSIVPALIQNASVGSADRAEGRLEL
jgi:hypothetical protein